MFHTHLENRTHYEPSKTEERIWLKSQPVFNSMVKEYVCLKEGITQERDWRRFIVNFKSSV